MVFGGKGGQRGMFFSGPGFPARIPATVSFLALMVSFPALMVSFLTLMVSVPARTVSFLTRMLFCRTRVGPWDCVQRYAL